MKVTRNSIWDFIVRDEKVMIRRNDAPHLSEFIPIEEYVRTRMFGDEQERNRKLHFLMQEFLTGEHIEIN